MTYRPRLSFIAPCILLILIPVTAAAGNGAGRWSIEVDVSSLETVLLRPEEILADPDAFWETDVAYSLAAKWHENVNIPLEKNGYYEKWLEKLRGYAAVQPEERAAHPAFVMLRAVDERIPRYRDEALPFLDEFLPANGMPIESAVNLTGGTLSYGFMTDGQVVIDVLSSHYKRDMDRIFNLVTHETFHLGYGWNRSLRTETPLDDSFVYNTMLDALHNEGLATWVGYSARSIFPNDDEPDYGKLDDPAEVDRQRGELNRLFTLAATVPTDSLKAIAWDVGVMKRAYYVTGADMARTIEGRLGREGLVATIETGPLAFVDTYNGLVDEDRRIVTFDKPAGPDPLPRLKHAALAHDRATFDAVAAELTAHRSELPARTRPCLERFGFGLTYLKDFDWALTVLELDVELFPDNAGSWRSLGWVHMDRGDTENATRFCRRSLEIAPDDVYAQRLLARIDAAE